MSGFLLLLTSIGMGYGYLWSGACCIWLPVSAKKFPSLLPKG